MRKLEWKEIETVFGDREKVWESERKMQESESSKNSRAVEEKGFRVGGKVLTPC